MRSIILLLTLLLSAVAQDINVPPGFILTSVNPTGVSCVSSQAGYYYQSVPYVCSGGVFIAYSSGGGGSVSVTAADSSIVVNPSPGTGTFTLAAGSTVATLTGTQTLSNKTLTAPILGTPMSGTLTNTTGLPLTSGVTGILPTANGGTGTATPALVSGSNVTITGTWPNQTIAAATGSGGGIISYSGPALTTVTGTVFCPAGGGGSCSTTETNVDLPSSSGATITNLSFQVSTALGVGNSVVVTWRKAGVSQSVTCTISGASQTECQDSAHSFTVAQGDEIDYQLVFSGTVIVNPFLLAMSQFGTTGSNGTVNSGTSGQLAYYSGSGTAVSGTTAALPPYFQIGSNLYLPQDGMYQATLPSFGSWTQQAGTTTVSTNTNGDVKLTTTSTTRALFADPTHTASIEVVVGGVSTSGTSNFIGAFIYDSTNSKVYTMDYQTSSASLLINVFTYSGSGNPTFSSTTATYSGIYGFVHLKMSIASTSLTLGYSTNGGQSFTTSTQTVGTISKIGIDSAGSPLVGEVFSVVTQ